MQTIYFSIYWWYIYTLKTRNWRKAVLLAFEDRRMFAFFCINMKSFGILNRKRMWRRKMFFLFWVLSGKSSVTWRKTGNRRKTITWQFHTHGRLKEVTADSFMPFRQRNNCLLKIWQHNSVLAWGSKLMKKQQGLCVQPFWPWISRL